MVDSDLTDPGSVFLSSLLRTFVQSLGGLLLKRMTAQVRVSPHPHFLFEFTEH